MTAFLDQTDPVLLAALGLGLAAFVAVIVLLARKPGTDPAISQAFNAFQQSQAELAGRLAQMDEQRNAASASLQDTLNTRLDAVSNQLNTSMSEQTARTMKTLEERLDAVNKRLGDGLQAQTETTQKTLSNFHERLAIIDQAQKNLTDLSSQVVDLQKVLDNKQARGAFGEVQLNNLVSQALPPSAYSFQHTLSNGKRPDCLITLPNPPGPICIDSKFPLEAYSALVSASDDEGRKRALSQFRSDVKHHITAIAEKYVLFGETADSALMFVPSESIYAEIHAGMPGTRQDACPGPVDRWTSVPCRRNG